MHKYIALTVRSVVMRWRVLKARTALEYEALILTQASGQMILTQSTLYLKIGISFQHIKDMGLGPNDNLTVSKENTCECAGFES